MSGTSLDGIDVSLISTDGIDTFNAIKNLHLPYTNQFKSSLKSLFTFDKNYLEIEQEFTNLHIKATLALIKQANISAESVNAIGFHGQTIFHDPLKFLTLQIGNPHLLAVKTGIDVIYDFRRRDMALGGQGAPLVPIFHKLLVKDEKEPVVILNIGGVANITYVDREQLIAFDTGPGNALIDDICAKYFNLPFDNKGSLASKGKIDHKIIDKFISNKYFTQKYPKSLDRNEFSFLIKNLQNHYPEDQIATLTYATVKSIVTSIALLPKIPSKILVCGGGAHNVQMMQWLEEFCTKDEQNIKLANIDSLGNFDSDFIESQAFAYLAARYIYKIPSAFPSTTGCSIANICGCLVSKN